MFAETVVDGTYGRFHQDHKARTFRIFTNKLGEVAFLEYLKSEGKNPDVSGIFDIRPGTSTVDVFDLRTRDGKTVDIKTASDLFHIRILVPYDQFENNRAKDYYVGIRMDVATMRAEICGFTTKERLMSNGKDDSSEGPVYWEYLSDLMPIRLLVNEI